MTWYMNQPRVLERTPECCLTMVRWLCWYDMYIHIYIYNYYYCYMCDIICNMYSIYIYIYICSIHKWMFCCESLYHYGPVGEWNSRQFHHVFCRRKMLVLTRESWNGVHGRSGYMLTYWPCGSFKFATDWLVKPEGYPKLNIQYSFKWWCWWM